MVNYKRNRPTIGVLPGWQAYSGQLDSYLDNVLYGIQSAAHDLEVNLMLACGVGMARELDLGSPAWPILQPGIKFIPVGPWNTDGLIVLPPLANEAGTEYFESLRAAGYPLVYAGEWKASPAVIVDNEGGIYQALDHLAGHGHRRIAFIAGRDHQGQGDSGNRLKGYLTCVRELGLEYDPELIAYGHHTYLGGRLAMQQIMASGQKFTAVLASNDESAVGAMDVLQQSGLLVPQDVALIGFDDRIEARAQLPLLTTVHYPMFELGYQSVELLLQHIQHPDLVTTIKIPTRLVIRESCGCLPGTVTGSASVENRLLVTPIPAMTLNSGGALPPAKPADGLSNEPPALDTEDQAIIAAMSKVTYNEVLRISLTEVEYLCRRLEEAFKASLAQANPLTFLLTIQQVAGRVASLGDELRNWQETISILRRYLPALMKQTASAFSDQQAEDMLHQARVVISEVSRGQNAKLLVQLANLSDEIGLMTSRFFAAEDEAEVYADLIRSLPGIGIQHAAAALYIPEDEDPVAWSELQTPLSPDGSPWRIPTRQFPPAGLYPVDKPFNLVLLPFEVPEMFQGFVAFDAGNLQYCAVILRQLEAALRGVRLHCEAVEARRLAEEERKTAEAANQMKSRFLSVVSHELRTPLNLIFGLSSMLLKGSEPTPEGQQQVDREDLEHIHVAAQHLNSLIRDVLDLAQSDVGQLRLICEPLDLRRELDAVSVIGQQLAQTKDLTWQVEIPEALPMVWGDRTRLRQVILNLVNNAVKFTNRGRVCLSACARDGLVTIRVQDTGLGIPGEEQSVIFEEFRQSERTTARGYGGLGLGLAICKRLVEMHGGDIGVCSSGIEGQGSTFYFTLPVLERQLAAPCEEIPVDRMRRVLLLVHDPASGELLKNHLLKQQFEVRVIQVTKETDWLAKLLYDLPDVLVMDLGLTSQWGWEIIKMLKENPATQQIPVMFYSLDGARQNGSLLEISYMTKPVGTAELAETLLNQGLLRGGCSDAASSVEDDNEKSQARAILIVDDDPGILDLHTRIVQAEFAQYQVITAHNGREALDKIHQQPPDLVLLDLMMPEMDGFSVLEAMRAEELSRNIPVIVLTAQALTEADMTRLNRGAVNVLSKGMFSVEETLQHIASALLRKRRPGSESQRIVSRAIAYLNANYTEAISLNDVARSTGLSERHLTRCFRQETGITPTTYLNRLRIKQAKTLIDAGEKSITRIAMDVGFSTGAYFTRVFKEEVGLSPREYTRQAYKG